MISLKVLTFSCLLTLAYGSENYQLNSLIQRIYNESYSASLLFINIDDELLTDFLKNNFEIPLSILNNYAALDNFRDFNTNKIIVVQTKDTNSIKYHQEAFLKKVIPKLHNRQFVIIAASNMDRLRDSFHFFFENRFTQIYGVINDTSYAYLPFEEQHIQVFSRKTAFIETYKNLNGFPVPITIEQDIPRVFQYPSQQFPYIRIGGYFGHVFKFFLITYNGSYNNIQIQNCTDNCINSINATLTNQVEISTNVYALGSIPGLDTSYPISNTFKTLLVPVLDYLDTNQYFLRPFSYTVWIFIGLTLVYLILMDFVIASNLKRAPSAWQSFRQIFLMMLGLPAGKQLTRNYRFYIQVILIAFILDNIYLNYFTSFLTVFIKIEQFDTKIDFYTYNVRILLPWGEWNRTAYTGMYPENFELLFRPVTMSEYKATRNAMNDTRFAYLTDSDIAEFLLQLQTRFSKPRFRIIRRRLNTAQLCFALPKHSPLKSILNRYIINLQQTGLMQKWNRYVISESLKANFNGVANRKHVAERLHTPLSLDHLIFAWNSLLFGLTSAFGSFVVERYGGNWKRKLAVWKYGLTMKANIWFRKNRKV